MSARRFTRTAAACGLLLVVAACGGSSGGSGSSSSPKATGVTDGGTLKLLGSGDVDHLDPASAYYTVSYTLERAFTRQLVSYPSSSEISVATSVAPDLATTLPTTANGGISADGKTYTFHVRPGVEWNTSPARAVTAADVVRGLQRICNPASPSGGVS
jgi:ABC-type transport system substrate-binding protein